MPHDALISWMVLAYRRHKLCFPLGNRENRATSAHNIFSSFYMNRANKGVHCLRESLKLPPDFCITFLLIRRAADGCVDVGDASVFANYPTILLPQI